MYFRSHHCTNALQVAGVWGRAVLENGGVPPINVRSYFHFGAEEGGGDSSRATFKKKGVLALTVASSKVIPLPEPFKRPTLAEWDITVNQVKSPQQPHISNCRPAWIDELTKTLEIDHHVISMHSDAMPKQPS